MSVPPSKALECNDLQRIMHVIYIMRIQSAEVGRGSRVPLAVQCPVTAVAIARVEATATKGHRLWRNSATSLKSFSPRTLHRNQYSDP